MMMMLRMIVNILISINMMNDAFNDDYDDMIVIIKLMMRITLYFLLF
jgi:hypothetical protein